MKRFTILLIILLALQAFADYTVDVQVIEEVTTVIPSPEVDSVLENLTEMLVSNETNATEILPEPNESLAVEAQNSSAPEFNESELVMLLANNETEAPPAEVEQPVEEPQTASVPFGPSEEEPETTSVQVDENLTVIEEVVTPPAAPYIGEALEVMVEELDDNETLAVVDAEGREVAANIVVQDDVVSIVFDEGIVKSMQLLNIENASELPRVDEVPADMPAPEGQVWAQIYAIDPTKTEFGVGIVEVVAKGTSLYKCKEWNFDGRSCDGTWQLVAEDMVPGNTYYLEINPDDPGFGEASPDNGTPDAGSYIPFGDGFSSTVNTFTATQVNDGTYFAIRQNNGVAAQLDLEAYLNLSYNLTPLVTSQNFTPAKTQNLTFLLEHCFNNDIAGGFTCGGGAPGGTIENPLSIELFNWTSNSYQRIGTYNGSSVNEGNATVTISSGFTNFINSTTNFVNVRYVVNVTIVTNGNDAAFGADFAPLTVTYDNVPPNITNTSIMPINPDVGNNVCLSANVSDSNNVSNVNATIDRPIDPDEIVQLFDNHTCNSIPNDGIFSNLYHVTREGIHNWTRINVTDGVGNSRNSSVGLSFESFFGGGVPSNLFVESTSTFDDNASLDISLINASDDIYATQTATIGNDTFMFFIWNLNLNGTVNDSNVTIEHHYVASTPPVVTFQIKNGSVWQDLCNLTANITDAIDTCDLDSFVNGDASFVNNLQLRTNVSNVTVSTKQNVDHVYITVDNVTFVPGIIIVVDSSSQPISFTSTVLQNDSGILTLELNFTDYTILSITLFGYNETSTNKTLRLRKNTSDDFARTFGIDASDVNFTTANVTVTAVGNTLYKCVDFNFTNGTCNDGYEFLMSLTPGENYTFTINSTDPGFGDSSPDQGTPDAGSYVPFGDGFSSTVNTFTATQVNDGTYFAIRQNNGVAAQLDLEAYLNLSYNLSSLFAQGASVSQIRNLTFVLEHCFNDDIAGGFACGGGAPGGTIENPLGIELFNWTSNAFQTIGTYTGSSVSEGNATVNVTSGFSDFINSTTNFVNIRYVVNVTILLLGNDAAFGADFAPLTVTFDQVVVNKTDSADPVMNGTQLNYTILINNTFNTTAFNVTVVESYPENVTFHNSSTAPVVGNNTFLLGNLSANTSTTLNITVNVSGAAPNGSVLNNSVNVTFNTSSGAQTTVTDSELTTVAAIVSSVTLSTNQTIFRQGTAATASENPNFGIKIFIPFDANYTGDGLPVTDGACSVTSNNSGRVTALTFNATTGNYTGQLDDMTEFDNTTYTVSCTSPSSPSASNSTTANIFWYNFIIETPNNISFGGVGNNLSNASTWLSKVEPNTTNVLNKTINITLAPNATDVSITEVSFCGSNTNINCTFLRDFNMQEPVIFRVNISASSNNTCQLRLCYHLRNTELFNIFESCGNVTDVSTLPAVVEQNITLDGITLEQGDFLLTHLHCDAHPDLASTTDVNLTLFYNYTGEPASIEIHHPEPSTLISEEVAHVQSEPNYTIGQNQTLNITVNHTTQFNNTFNGTRFLRFFDVLDTLLQFKPSVIPNRTIIYNSTGQIWASDNASLNATETVMVTSDDVVIYDTEPIPALSVINETAQVDHGDAVRDNESFVSNISGEVTWQIEVKTIFTADISVENITVFTNYSAYGVPDDFAFSANVSNSSGTFDITNQTIVNTTAKTLTFPIQKLSAIMFNVSARDVSAPSVNNVTAIPSNVIQTFSTNISANVTNGGSVDTVLANITFSNGTIVQQAMAAAGDIYSTLFTPSLTDPIGVYNVTIIANDTRNNINDSEGTNFTVIDVTPPSVTILSPAVASDFLVNDSVNISANVTDNIGINHSHIEVTHPNGTITVFEINQGGVINATFTNLTQRGNYTITIFTNDTSDNINNAETRTFRRIPAYGHVIDVVDENNVSVNFTEAVMQNASSMLEIHLNFTNSTVLSINISNHSEMSPFNVLRLANRTNDTGRFSRAFAIDLTNFNMSHVNVTATAVGNTLYKCTNYTFSNVTCNDNYEFLQSLIPGQNYTFTLNSSLDPGFGDQSPSEGTPDAGNYVAFGDGFSSTVNTFTALQTNDGVYFAVRRANGGAAQLDLEAYLNVSYNLTNLTSRGITPNKMTNWEFRMEHCYNDDIVGAFTCGGSAPGGTVEDPLAIELFNFTSQLYQQIGTYNGSLISEGNASVNVTSGFADFINSTTNFVNIQYVVNVTIVINGNDAAFGADFSPLIVTFQEVFVNKTDNPDPVLRGSQLNYTILVNNTRNSTIFNVTVTEGYPSGVGFHSSSPVPSSGNNTFSLGNLSANTSTTVNITVNVSSSLSNGTILNNSVNLTFANSSGLNTTVNDSELTTVRGERNLTITKTDNPDPIDSGGTLSYQILVNNTGDDTAFNVTVIEIYPANVTFNGSTPPPTSGNNTWLLGNLEPNQSTTINITVNVSSAMTSGFLNDTVFANASNFVGTNQTVNDSELTTVIPGGINVSNITLTKLDSPDPVAKGTQLNYSVVVNSTGNGTAFNVTVIEGYPPGVGFHNSSPAPSAGNNTFSLGDLPNGTSFIINITVNVSSSLTNGTVLNNLVNSTFQFSTGLNGTSTDSELTTVIGFPVIITNKTGSPDPVSNGSALTYQILINNTGDEIAYNVTVFELYPLNVSFNNSSPAPISGNDTFSAGNISPGGFTTINITVNVSIYNDTILNNSYNVTFANLSGTNLTVTNNTLTTATLAVINVTNATITKTDNPDPVVRGQQLNYTLNITNTGNTVAFNVTVVEGYPSGVVFDSSSPSPTVGNNTFALGDLAVGESTTINITVNVSNALVNGTLLNNTVNLTFANSSGVNGTANASETTTVIGFPEFIVVKIGSPDPVLNGTTLTYTITITNTGDEIAYNVTVVDDYPVNVTFNGSSPTNSSGNNTFLVGNLTPGSSTTVNITVNVSADMITGVLNNTVNVTFANASGTNLTVNDSVLTTVTSFIPPTPAVAGQGGGGGGGPSALICPAYCREPRYQNVQVCRSEACNVTHAVIPPPITFPEIQPRPAVEEPVSQAETEEEQPVSIEMAEEPAEPPAPVVRNRFAGIEIFVKLLAIILMLAIACFVTYKNSVWLVEARRRKK